MSIWSQNYALAAYLVQLPQFFMAFKSYYVINAINSIYICEVKVVNLKAGSLTLWNFICHSPEAGRRGEYVDITYRVNHVFWHIMSADELGNIFNYSFFTIFDVDLLKLFAASNILEQLLFRLGGLHLFYKNSKFKNK